MDTRQIFRTCVSICLFMLAGIASACGASPIETPFIPPASSPKGTTPTSPPDFILATLPPTETLIPSPTPIPPCSPGLTYVADITIPDGSIVAPGSVLEKQWSVQNSGTCDWDSRFRLKLVSGLDMGIPEQPLYPARNSTQAVLQLLLTAPLTSGSYTSAWQAIAPDGTPFGDILTISIFVQQP